MSNHYRQFSQIYKFNPEQRSVVENIVNQLVKEHAEGPNEHEKFKWELQENQLWLYADEWFDLEVVVELISRLQLALNDNRCFHLSWCCHCSEPRPGVFYGGTAIIYKGVEGYCCPTVQSEICEQTIAKILYQKSKF